MRRQASERRVGLRRKSVAGLILVAGVALALLAGPPARGGVPAGASYLGSKLCVACHQATHPQAVAGWATSAHAHTLWPIEESDESQKVVADFAKSAFPKEQAAYVVGAGNRYQAFLDKDLKVLPGEWAAKSKSWRPREAMDARQDCLGCHTTGYDPAAAHWVELDVACEMCHGPGSVHAGSADKKETIVMVQSLDPAHQAMVCGQCHSQGRSKDSKYPFPVGFRPGDDLDQFFTYTEEIPRGAMNSQYNELRFGGGKHLASGTVCTTCHDPHGSGVPNELRAPVNQLCQKCHTKLTGSQHSKEALAVVTCAVCHMPGGKHTFVPPKGLP